MQLIKVYLLKNDIISSELPLLPGISRFYICELLNEFFIFF